MHTKKKLFICFCLFVAMSWVTPLLSAEETITELLLFETYAPALLTKSVREKTPATVTTITAQQISMTPARNIYDLIEVYVPGSHWMNHHESPHFGTRGIMSDRNYKFILLVNGRKINQDAHSGAELELENWDMNDIDHIDIVRGPGSVTYGPGAVQAVINIVTKNANNYSGTHAGVGYVYPYDSKSMYVSHGLVEKAFQVFAYASAVRTSGIQPREFFVDNNNNAGYLGDDPDLPNTKALYYFNDADNKPQMKFNVELDFLKEWQFWARYSNFGTSRHASTAQTLTPDGLYYLNVKENKDQGAMAVVRNQHAFGNGLELKSMASFSSLDHQRKQYNVSGGGSISDLNSIRNTNHEFSENEFLASAIANYPILPTYQVAAGLEYSQKWFSPAWDGTQATFRMGDSSNIFGSQDGATASGAAQPYFLANNGWKSYKLSYLAEANLEFDPKLSLIASARVDDHEFSNPVLSPRVGLISDLNQYGLAKLIWQKSIRMNTEEQLLLSDLTDTAPQAETLAGVEFNYNLTPLPGFELLSSFFYNTLEIVGWTATSVSTSGFSYGMSTVLGNVRLWGVELESKYKAGAMSFGLAQTYTKQLSFECTLPDNAKTQGISYSDYDYTASGLHMVDTGNDLNNWSNLSTKVYSDYQLAPEHTVHLDLRAFWGFQGALDGLTMLENASKGTAREADVARSLKEIRDQNAYKLDLRVNASYRYQFLPNTSLTLFGMNLLNLTGNKRYSYDAGVVRASPYRTNWIEEPLSLGVKVDYTF